MDVGVFAKFEHDGFAAAFDPNFDLCIEIEVPSSLLGKVINALVGHTGVFTLLTGNALFVHEEQPEVGENNQVAEKLVGILNLLSVYQKFRKFFFQY